MNWKIEHTADGYRIIDGTGCCRGQYHNANELATYLAALMRAGDKLLRSHNYAATVTLGWSI